jgi:hypothetical protein
VATIYAAGRSDYGGRRFAACGVQRDASSRLRRRAPILENMLGARDP